MTFFSSKILMAMLADMNGFDSIDGNADGFISQTELVQALHQSGRSPMVTKLLVSNLFNIADANGDGLISKEEMFRLVLSQSSPRENARRGSSRISVEDIVMDVKRVYSFDSDIAEQISRQLSENLEADIEDTVQKQKLEELSACIVASQSKKARI